MISLFILLFTIRQKITMPFKTQRKITELFLWSRLRQEHLYPYDSC